MTQSRAIQIEGNAVNGAPILFSDGSVHVTGQFIVNGIRAYIYIPHNQLAGAGVAIDASECEACWSHWDYFLRRPHTLCAALRKKFAQATEVHVHVLLDQSSPRIGIASA